MALLMRMRVVDLIPYTGNTARTGCCETQILVFTKKVGLGRGINLPVLTQCMNVLQVLFPADKLQAQASLISLPALVLAKLPAQAGQEHNHHTAAFLAGKAL